MATKIRPFNLHTDTETRIQTLAGNLIDSAYVNARVSTVDSAAVQVIVDSDYVKSTLKVGSTNTIFRYVATANQTSFTGSDANSATLAYNPGAVQVFLNGSLLTPTVDFSTDSGDTITLVSGAALGSELVINTYKDGIITPTNALPIIGGELTGNLTMGDNRKIKLGNDSDAEIFHNASNTIINDKGTGDILLQVAGTTHFKTDANGVQIPDNKKLLLGASSDLQIYHDGSNSFVDDAGSGSLYLRGESQVIIGNMSGEQAAVFNDDGAVTLNYDNSQKLATTAAGVSVTGTITGTLATAAQPNVNSLGTLSTLTVDDITINGSTISDAGDLTLDVAGVLNLDTDAGGIYFKDGGTTIGEFINSSSDFMLKSAVQDKDILFKGNDGGSTITALTLDMSDAGTALFNHDIKMPNAGNIYFLASSGYSPIISNSGNTNSISIFTGNSERMRITSGGNVGIGTTSPAPSGGSDITLEIAGSSGPSLTINDTGQAEKYSLLANSNDLKIYYGSTPMVSFQNDGNVGIGTASPSSPLHIFGSSPKITLEHSNQNGTAQIYSTAQSAIVLDADPDDTDSGTPIIFKTDGSERMRIDNLGNIGIAQQTPTSMLHLLKNSGGTQVVANFSAHNYGDTAATFIQIGTEHNDGSSRIGSINTVSDGGNTSALVFQTHSTSSSTFIEALRIKYHGRMNAFNCTNGNGNLNVVGEVGSSYKAISFAHTTNGGEVGSIKTASSSTNYDTTSDYRLKENVIYDFDATSRLKQLKPVRFNFKIDKDKTVDGFLAHEVSSIVPNAISGEKDGVQVWEKSLVGEDLPDGISIGDNILDDNGNTIPDYQSIDHSKLVPLLTKALQEQQATIEALTARITELENK